MSEQEKCGKVINSLAETREFIAVTKNMFKIGFPDIVSDVFDNALCAISDAIILLKAQEPVTAIVVLNSIDGSGGWWYQCPKCKMEISPRDKYCKSCGQAVKWK